MCFLKGGIIGEKKNAEKWMNEGINQARKEMQYHEIHHPLVFQI